MTMTLTEVISYPLKSGAGLGHETAQLSSRGLQWDRRWMAVDEDGRFISARTHPQLLLIEPQVSAEGHLTLWASNMGTLVATMPSDDHVRRVHVWSDQCDATGFGPEADDWISDFLGQKAHLVFMPDSTRRTVKGDFSAAEDIVGFADGFPLLLAQSASLLDLNQRLSEPIPMNRFRPNLVVDGGRPFDEFTWKRIRVGECEFVTGGPCVRCIMTTVDASSGLPGSNGEPLKTLATYQRNEKGVIFGINLIPRRLGPIHLGDTVEVLESL